MLDGRLRPALLLGALALVALSAYQPHWSPDEGHAPFPVHLDEYVHWGYARAVQAEGSVVVDDPFAADDLAPDDLESGGRSFRYPGELHERGFHAYLAMVQAVTGIPWLALIEFTPTAVALLLALSIYVLAERWGAGVEAVLWLAAVPTSLRFLGPGFLVPIMFSLPLVIIGTAILMHHEGRRTWISIALLDLALWTIHPMGALLLTAIVLLYAITRGLTWRRAFLVVALFVPLALSWPFYRAFFVTGLGSDIGLPAGTESVLIMGPAAFVLAAVGAAWLVASREPGRRAGGVALGAALVVALWFAIWRQTHAIDPFRLYDRAMTILPVLVAIFAGCGTRAAILAVRRAGRRHATGVVTVAVAAILVAQVVAVAAAQRANGEQIYYRVMGERERAQYEAAAEALQPHHRRALVDGVATMAWTDVTGIPTMYVQTPAAGAPPPAVQQFFAQGARDTAFLIEHGVSIVVTDRSVNNPDLHLLVPGVYVLDDRYALRLAATL